MDLAVLQQQAPSPIQRLDDPLFHKKGVTLWIKRDDLLHLPVEGAIAFCGNKWRKLKYNLYQAQVTKTRHLLTFGGAYSNHIAAVATAGHLFNFETTGVIRGEIRHPLNPTLALAEKFGMQLQSLSRTLYRQKDSPQFLQSLQDELGPFYLIPEGGTNPLALKGCAELAQEIHSQLSDTPNQYICCSAGTGGTVAGLISASSPTTRILAFSSLKGDFLQEAIQDLLGSTPQRNPVNWSLQTNYAFGGYAKVKPPLIDFINSFWENYQIALDPIYTGKLFYGIFDLIQQDYFPAGSQIVAIHTGGLQGIAGFQQRFGPVLKLPNYLTRP